MGRLSQGFGFGILGMVLGVGNAAYAWTPTITPAAVASGTAGINSSTQVTVSWTACPLSACMTTPSSYRVLVYRGGVLQQTVSSTSLSAAISDLRAGTAYTFQIRACTSLGCSTAVTSTNTASHTLAVEAWQLVGPSSANTYTGVDEVALSETYAGSGTYQGDGSTLSYAIRYGATAGTTLAGYTLLAYNPLPAAAGGVWPEPGVRFNISSAATTSQANLTDFRTADWTWGFVREITTAAELEINAFQLVPLIDDSAVRLFFEAEDTSGVNRLYSIDSLDGLTGLDYRATSASGSEVCGGVTGDQPDLSTTTTQECASAIEVDIDSTAIKYTGDTGLSQVRQSKVGYPVQTDWRWDPTESAFLVMTGTSRTTGWGGTPAGPVGCPDYTASEDHLFYAIWNGTTWDVEIDAEGCAVALVKQAHGPVPTHLSDQLYKMYYEDTSTATNKCQKPLKMIYGDGEETGATDVVDFDDWDTAHPADVDFYWPTGVKLNADQESGLGDHMVLNLPAVGTNPAIQVMYLNLGGPDGPGCPSTTSSAGIGAAILLNP